MSAIHRTYCVLVVDDNPAACQQLGSQLRDLGHRATLAGSANEAEEILVKESAAAFDCLITDCGMEDRTGLDLLQWLGNYDYTLASVVVSADPDEELVMRTLRGGASDCIGKPVVRKDLERALSKAIPSTQRRRRAAATQTAVRDAGVLHRRMNNLHAADELPTEVTICYHPKFEAGGDSVTFFPFDSSRMLVVVADVSGHDLKSALLSAYFQGMLRGMIEQHVPIDQILNRFNRFLVHDWLASAARVSLRSPEISSLSVCSALVDLEAGSVCVSSSGFPLPTRIDGNGLPNICNVNSGYPLGWFDPNPVSSISVPARNGDHLVVWTDGLEEFANQLQINTWSLAYRILETRGSPEALEWLADAMDDVLLVHIALSKSGGELKRIPVLVETYEKQQLSMIDELQDNWQRSLQFAFPKLEADILYDILLCIREAVINGLLHGCRVASDTCHLAVIIDMDDQRLRIDVSDSGPGHQFDVKKHAKSAFEHMLSVHRGLLLIHSIADKVEQEDNGASIHIFIDLQTKPDRQLKLA